jgi:MoxR-like ATPase
LDSPPLVNIGRKAAPEFSDEADFMFITSSLEESPTFLQEVEGLADTLLAGRSATRLNSKHLKIAIISFHPTLRDLIQAILEAKPQIPPGL